MRTSRYSEEQIIGLLREHEAGATVADLGCRHGVSQQTIYRWKQKYGGMETSKLRRLKQLEPETTRLKRLVADQELDNQILKELLEKVVTPVDLRETVANLRERFSVSERRAYRLVGVSHSMVRYRRRGRDDAAFVERWRALAR